MTIQTQLLIWMCIHSSLQTPTANWKLKTEMHVWHRDLLWLNPFLGSPFGYFYFFFSAGSALPPVLYCIFFGWSLVAGWGNALHDIDCTPPDPCFDLFISLVCVCTCRVLIALTKDKRQIKVDGTRLHPNTAKVGLVNIQPPPLCFSSLVPFPRQTERSLRFLLISKIKCVLMLQPWGV